MYCPKDDNVTDNERARKQHEIVERLRAVSAWMVTDAADALSGASDEHDRDLAWAVLRLATERPELWDAMAQLVQVRMLVDATERAELDGSGDPVSTAPGRAGYVADEPSTLGPGERGKAAERRRDAEAIVGAVIGMVGHAVTVDMKSALACGAAIETALHNAESRSIEP